MSNRSPNKAGKRNCTVANSGSRCHEQRACLRKVLKGSSEKATRLARKFGLKTAQQMLDEKRAEDRSE